MTSEKLHILEAEERALGLTHDKLGKELAESWGIPAPLIEAITYHHHPKMAERDSELACLVHVGDAMARNLEYGSGGDPFVPCIRSYAFEHLAIAPEDLVDWEEEMRVGIDKDMAFLSAIA